MTASEEAIYHSVNPEYSPVTPGWYLVCAGCGYYHECDITVACPKCGSTRTYRHWIGENANPLLVAQEIRHDLSVTVEATERKGKYQTIGTGGDCRE